jgi:hypothetical protein
LLALRRALRNGTVWIDHSLAFRSRERLFIPAETWVHIPVHGERGFQCIVNADSRQT